MLFNLMGTFCGSITMGSSNFFFTPLISKSGRSGHGLHPKSRCWLTVCRGSWNRIAASDKPSCSFSFFEPSWRPVELPKDVNLLLNYELFWSSWLWIRWQLSNCLPEILWPIVGNGKLSTRNALQQLFVSQFHMSFPQRCRSAPFSSQLGLEEPSCGISRLATTWSSELTKAWQKIVFDWGLSTCQRPFKSQPQEASSCYIMFVQHETSGAFGCVETTTLRPPRQHECPILSPGLCMMVGWWS